VGSVWKYGRNHKGIRGGHLRRLGAKHARRRADGEEEKQEGSRTGQRTTSVGRTDIAGDDNQKTRHSYCGCEKGEGLGRRPWLDRVKDPEEGAQVFPGVEEWTETTSASLQEPRQAAQNKFRLQCKEIRRRR